MQSESLSLNRADVKKILVGFGVAIGSAALTYIADTLPHVDFGSYTPIAVAVASVIVNTGRKLLAGYSV